MEPQNEWVFFQDIDWNCPKNNQFNVDTRDFHVGYHFEKNPHKDMDTLKNYPDFWHTEIELKATIERLFNESGGKGEWRMLSLICNSERVRNWNLKYLRIWRTDIGFLICNSDKVALRKAMLVCDVDQEHLGHH